VSPGSDLAARRPAPAAARRPSGCRIDSDGEADVDEIEVVRGAPAPSLDEVRRRVREYAAGTGVTRAIVFGSFARGDADLASDLDVILIEPTSRPFLERGLAHLPLFRIGVGVDLLVYTPEEYDRLRADGHPLIERAEREGITVYAQPDSGGSEVARTG
jgi:predicted nucleotidyltransferase